MILDKMWLPFLIPSACALAVAAAVNAQQHQTPLVPFEKKHKPEHYTFDPLIHLPGISPYFDAQGFGLQDASPLGCKVTAASYLVRHSAIYANDADYEKFIQPFLEKLDDSDRSGWTGPLSPFADGWESPIDDPDNQLEQLTPDGADSARKVAEHLFQRYPELVPTTKKIYSDDKPRTRDTAKAFTQVFPREIELIQISKKDKRFHAIIPHKSCPNFSKSSGDDELHRFAQHYTRSTIARLKPHAPVNLTAYDIIGMQQLCGYESAINGKVSQLCEIFTPLEWLQYEYMWDVKYSYMVGPGNPLSPYLGFPWLNVTANLFSKFHEPHSTTQPGSGSGVPDDDGQRFFISFTHREVPPFLATALGLFNSSSETREEFPTDRVNFGRAWKMAELIPFLGHIGIEKMTCDSSSGALHGEEYVRIMANSAPRPIPRCQDGPGASCSIHNFLDLIQAGLERYGNFKEVCGFEDPSVSVTWE